MDMTNNAANRTRVLADLESSALGDPVQVIAFLMGYQKGSYNGMFSTRSVVALFNHAGEKVPAEIQSADTVCSLKKTKFASLAWKALSKKGAPFKDKVAISTTILCR